MSLLQSLTAAERRKLLDAVLGTYVTVPGEPGETLVLGLANSDLSGCLYGLLSLYPDAFPEGVEALGELLGTKDTILYLPHWAEPDEAIRSRLRESGMRLKDEDFIDIRREPGYYCHIADVLKVRDLLEKRDTDYTFLSVNGGPLQKVPNGRTLRELLGDSTAAQWLEIGSTWADTSSLGQTVGQLRVTNGVVNAVPAESCVLHDNAGRLRQYREKSCGKCLFCREGLIQLDGAMQDIVSAKGKDSSLPLMKEIGAAMLDGCECSLGEEAARGLLSTLDCAEESVRQHIEKRKCPEGVCIKSGTVYIDPFACTGCTDCVNSCPLDCIDGKKGYIHLLYDVDCTKCEACLSSCPEGAIRKTESKPPRLPDRLVKAGMFRY